MRNPRFYKKVAGCLIETSETVTPADKIQEVRMTGPGFFEMRNRVYEAESDVAWMKKKLESQAETIKTLVRQKKESDSKADRLDKENRDLQGELATMKLENTDLSNKLTYAQSLRVNLLRINKEKSNKDRNLPRRFDGYMVINSRQVKQVYDHAYTEEDYADKPSWFHEENPDYVERREVIAWKTTIQTPYKTGLYPLGTIEDLILKDLFEEGQILPTMGCNLINSKINNGKFEVFGDDENANLAYMWQFNRDFKAGYWSIDVYTKKELDIPDERIAVKGDKNHES